MPNPLSVDCCRSWMAAAVLLMGGGLLMAGCSTMYEYRSADEQSIGEVCSGGLESEKPLLMQSACGSTLTEYTGQAACEAGNGHGCAVAALGAMGEGGVSRALEEGKKASGDRSSARKFARRGCNSGNESSCLIQAMLLMTSKSAYDQREAMRLLDQKCKRAGMPAVCNTIGVVFEKNAKNARDRKRAFDYFERSCNQEFPAGCWKLGKMYEKGFGVSESQTRAKAKFQQACELNHPKACKAVGEEADGKKKELLFEKAQVTKKAFVDMGMTACENGFRHACTFVGRLIDRGELRGRLIEGDKADALYNKGCERGAAHSCYYLAQRIKRRNGSVAQLTEGQRLAGKACDEGVEPACELIGELQAAVASEKTVSSLAKRCKEGGSTDETTEDEPDVDRVREPCFVAAEAQVKSGQFSGDQKRAIALHRQGCKNGNARSCRRAGELVESDKEAKGLYEKACKGGDAHGCFELGAVLEADGDRQEAVSRYSEACTGGFGRACGSLASYYENGNIVDKDMARAEKLHRSGCQAGHVASCRDLAMFFLEHTQTEESVLRGLQLLELACRRDDGNACAQIGMISEGWNDSPFEKSPRDYLEKACLLESGLGCAAFGDAYRKGSIVDQDMGKALQLYDQSCSYGSGSGCTNLGNVYRFGIEVERDADKARSAYERACEIDYGPGCKGLANMKLADPAEPYAPKKAAQLLRKGCGTSHYGSCRQYAALYADGVHLEQSFDKVVAGLQEGCEAGSTDTCDALANYVRLGIATDRDPDRSDELSKRYADAQKNDCETYKQAEACIALGHHMAHGQGTRTKAAAGREFLRKKCDDGMTGACREVGVLKAQGHIFPRSFSAGVDQLRSLCNDGHDGACVDAAYFMRYGPSDAIELTRSADYYRKACSDDDSPACRRLGYAYLHGLGDFERAQSKLKATCRDEDNRGCLAYVETLIRGNATDAAGELYEWTSAGCKQNDWTDCAVVGALEASGIGTDRNLTSAASRYKQACQAGGGIHTCALASGLEGLQSSQSSPPGPGACSQESPKTCTAAGAAAAAGIARSRAPGEAAKLLETGCRGGDALACKMRVSMHYLQLEPLVGDALYDFVERACDEANGAYCFDVGIRVANHDFAAGTKLVQKACSRGDTRACLWLTDRGKKASN
ncbi:MAG: tetratricopeptide repeat protein [Bradymonadaceae bacterium]